MLQSTECNAISPDPYITEYRRLTKTKLTGKQLWLKGTIRYRWQKPIVKIVRWFLRQDAVLLQQATVLAIAIMWGWIFWMIVSMWLGV